MNWSWYVNRLKKMNAAEVFKRLEEYLFIYLSRIRYYNITKWPYKRFINENLSLRRHSLPGLTSSNNWRKYSIYNLSFDLNKNLDWYFSDQKQKRWPNLHFSKINYRPDNPYGDVRINWELNRLQFLPAMAINNEGLAKNIINDWMDNNRFLCGPAYLSSMEVALRWFSVYWAFCLFRKPISKTFIENLTGLAFVSGKYISSRLSTHSSAGNHLIVEAVGLFWIGKSLDSSTIGAQWIKKARSILQVEIPKQINPDGSNQEQSFWYLGFVLDAILMYLLMEDRSKVSHEIENRLIKALEFLNEMTDSQGRFPDYGDRDDGFCFRIDDDYKEPPFPGLLNLGSFFLDRSEWKKNTLKSIERLSFWSGNGDICNERFNEPKKAR